MTLLSIIILSYNTKELTIRCLESLIQHYKNSLIKNQLEIIIVDNASTDGSAAYIKKYCKNIKNIKVVENKENVGFSGGNNVGVRFAQGEYLLFLNSDTLVQDKEFLTMIENFKKLKNCGLMGGALQNEDGSYQKSVGKFLTIPTTILMLLGIERLGFLRFSPKTICKVDWVSGACMLTTVKIFNSLGRFDQNIFMYIEDMELCYRAYKNKYAVYFYPFTKILHKEQGSSNRGFAIKNIYKGLLYFYKKHGNSFQYNFVKILLIIKAYTAIIIGMVTGNAYLQNTYRKAISP